jgi:oxygen-independent coproporphyrinogen-3 oxidase
MKLNLNGNINRIYVQSLCLMFYHGVKFPVNEESDDDLELTLDVCELVEGILCRALLRDGDREESAEDFCAFSCDESKDRTYKIAIGRAIFEAGNRLTGKEIGWGILTGIRPSKVAADIIADSSFDEAKRILEEKYLLSE